MNPTTGLPRRQDRSLGWICWRAGLLLVGCLALARAEAAGAGPRVIHAGNRRPAIPFHLNRSPDALKQIASVRLFVRAEGSADWIEQDRRSPAETRFQPSFSSDGTYWLAIRTMDHAGELHPKGPLAPDLQVIVDTVRPFVNVRIEKTRGGEFLAKIRASDPHLELTNLKIEGNFLAGDGRRRLLEPSSLESKTDEAGVNLYAHWRDVSSSACRVRVSVTDKAGNQAEKEATWAAKAGPMILQTQGTRIKSRDERSSGDLIFPIPEPRLPPRPTNDPTKMHAPAGAGRLTVPPVSAPAPKQKNLESPPPAELDIDRSELLLRAARNAVKLGDRGEALRRLEELLQLAPVHEEARFEYAGLLIQEKRLSEAQTELQLLVDQNPNVATYRAALADLLIGQGQYELARAELFWLLELPSERTAAAVKLSKTFAWEKRTEDAIRIYDTYLKHLTNLQPTDQRELAGLLMTMNRTRDAIELLVPLHKRQKESAYDPAAVDESVLADLILAYSRLRQRSTALVYLEDLRSQTIAQSDLWLKLAEQLYEEMAYVEALQVYEVIARDCPNVPQAKLGAARTHLRLFQTSMARQILDELKAEGAFEDLLYSTVEADYHTVVGNWATAISITEQRLRDNPNDIEAMILLGNVYRSSRQYVKAREIYTKALGLTEETEELELLLAKNLLEQRLFADAAARLESLLIKRTDNIAARLMLIQALRKSKRLAEAESLARPGPNDIDPRHQYALRVELGYVLLDSGRFPEALREFETLLDWPDGITPDAAYGVYRAQSSLNHPQAGRAALLLGPTLTAPAAEWAIIVSGRAMGDCDCPLAQEVMDQFLKMDPYNLAALNLRGEAAHQCDCSCAKPKDCSGCDLDCCECSDGGRQVRAFFELALEQSPDNLRARLGRARSLVKHHLFEEAHAEYLQLLDYLPHNINFRRELGRLLDGWKGIEHAETWYATPFDVCGSADPLFSGIPGINAESTSPSEFRLLAGTTIGEEMPALENELMTTEYQAKYLRGWRNRCSIPLYEGLITREPTNEEAYFDLGQVYAGMGHTRCAIEAYRRLLEVNPCHHQGWQAYQRLQLELRPQLHSYFEYVDKDGRDGLADIRWARPTIAGHFPLGDAGEYVQFGYRHMVLRPSDDAVNHGEIGFTRLQKKLSSDWLAFGEVDVEEYDYGFKTRPTFEAGTQYTFDNDAVLRGFGFLNNVYENGESIRQDIYRAGVQVEGTWQPLRRWQLSGMYRWADYSDDNAMNEFALNGAYRILRGRRQLRSLVDFNFLTYANESILPAGPGIFGTIHPYFAPQSFSFGTIGLEWKHWLSCDNFLGADQWWYRVYLGGRFDSQSESYFLFKGEMLYDIKSWLTWSVEGSVIESEVYDENRIGTYGIIRFP